MKYTIACILLALLPLPGKSQDKYETFAIFVTGMGSAAPVAESLIKQLNASKPFQAVSKNDSSKVVVLVSCLERKSSDPFACMYISHNNGATFKTFLGGGMYIATSADLVAEHFLGSIAQDVLERFEDTNTQNLREALEACLLLTDTKCNVPDALQSELGGKQLTLGQYLLKRHP